MHPQKLIASAVVVWTFALLAASHPTTVSASTDSRDDRNLDSDLTAVLSAAGFTGDIETTFQDRLRENLGRPIDQKLADLGRLLWFDNAHSLHKDNTCGGCHSPSNGFGDTPFRAALARGNVVLITHLVDLPDGRLELLLPPDDQRLLLPGGAVRFLPNTPCGTHVHVQLPAALP